MAKCTAGERYEAEVPDTLDLADRMGLAMTPSRARSRRSSGSNSLVSKPRALALMTLPGPMQT